jgi:cytochrome c-type biogenesis protein CcmH
MKPPRAPHPPSPTLPRSAGEGADSAFHRPVAQRRSSASPLRRLVASLALALCCAAPALAVEPSEKLADPALEARARAIASELRCLVCQNQSIDDSDAPLAKDLRLLLRERLKSGASDAEVRAFLVARYGDFVLLRPPLKLQTLLLWATAPLLLLLGGFAAFRAQARARLAPRPAALTDEERERLRALGVAPPEDRD